MSVALVLSPRQAAARLGVDHTTIRNWVRTGHCPDVFANLPTTRIGVPLWWVEALISPEPSVVVGRGDGGAAPLTASAAGGTPTLRSVRGSYPRPA